MVQSTWEKQATIPNPDNLIAEFEKQAVIEGKDISDPDVKVLLEVARAAGHYV